MLQPACLAIAVALGTPPTAVATPSAASADSRLRRVDGDIARTEAMLRTPPDPSAEADLLVHLAILWQLECALRATAATATSPPSGRGATGGCLDHVIRLEDDALAKDPALPRGDEILVSLGQLLDAAGRPHDAVARYQTMLVDFPGSKLFAAAEGALGDDLFDIGDLSGARAAYQAQLASGKSMSALYARYKLAWCAYKSGDTRRAVADLQGVVDLATAAAARMDDPDERRMARQLGEEAGLDMAALRGTATEPAAPRP